MRKAMIWAGIFVAAALVAAIAVLFAWKARSPARMEFTREGISGKIAQAVERVVKPGRAQVAVRSLANARLVCIVVDEAARHYELDEGMRVEDYPALEKGGFRAPSAFVSRTMSIYRSVAKTAMDYDSGRGDRIIVVLCPKQDWGRLRMTWPQ